ncbi:MAG: AraC family transcriptional regulator [Myxococcales bacterium]|nr:AraC family transcriptional regulator [Myxococcales bacterium]
MDALSQALNAVHVKSAVFCSAQLTAGSGFRSPKVTGDLARHLHPGADRIVGYHLVTEGHASVQLGDVQFPVMPGDVVIAPHGDDLTIKYLAPHAQRGPNVPVGSQHRDHGDPRRRDQQAVTGLVWGYLGCERHADRLFLAGLPKCIHDSRSEDRSGRWIEHSMRHLTSDLDATICGRSALHARVAEALLVESLRRYMLRLPPESRGWLAGARDPIVGAALALLHRAPESPWTLTTLAVATGVSRSVLTDRFTDHLGEPPLTYLARWRMQLAARLLEGSRNTIIQVAAEVGYDSESAFCRAFKRTYGLPPGQYRKLAFRRSHRA